MPGAVPPDVDDPTIADAEILYFRVYPYPDMIQPASDAGQYRPASATLKFDGPMSVDLESLSTPEQTRDRERSTHFHVAGFTAGTARKYGCRIVRDPTEASPTHPANPAHALVFGNHESGNGAFAHKSQGRHIAHEARFVLFNELAPR